MAKRKDIDFQPSKELENELNERAKPTYPPLDTKLHQNLNLGKGERGKVASSAHPLGKKVEQQERKRK